ncbi:MAG: ferritin-like domain-containing protein [Myxococcota bacterium]
MAEPTDLHQMDPAEFRDHVRSFEFWFGAVQGYLEGLSYGHRVDTPDVEFTESERDRLITVLCNYCIGETTALEGSGALIRVAPNRPTKVFLSTQTVDEGRHLEVLIHRLQELGVENPEAEIRRRASPTLLAFKQRLLELVRGEDWEAAVFAQNVCLEAMEFSVFHLHARSADARTREILLGIIKDERRHIGFGENELGRCLKQDPRIRERLVRVRQELDPLILESFRLTLERIEAQPDDHAELGRSYLDAVGRLGFA